MQPSYTGNASGTLTIARAGQTIAFSALPGVAVGAAPFPLTASASSGLPVAFVSGRNPVGRDRVGNTVTVQAAGTTTITASQTGNSDVQAATSVPQSLTVNAAAPAVPATGAATASLLAVLLAFVGVWPLRRRTRRSGPAGAVR